MVGVPICSYANCAVGAAQSRQSSVEEQTLIGMVSACVVYEACCAV